MKTKTRYCIGVMSGTSLDGVDICYVRFDYGLEYTFKILNAVTIAYPENWKENLQNAFHGDEVYLKNLDIEYGAYIGNLVHQFCQENSITNIDFIASHGHTIFHKPEEGYTLQIGDGQIMADITKLLVVCDFRTQDVELGGQGAPLVPIGDALLFYNYDYCLNLGGFANISFKGSNKRIAFDVCPVNIVLNYYVNSLGLSYDDKGKLASSGNINLKLLEELNQLEFYHRAYPKSLGLEWVVEFIFPLIDAYKLEVKDVLRTFIEHVAFQISEVIQNNSKILITGGGAFNDYLVQRIEHYLQQKVELPANEIIDYKEALIFAFLGMLRIEGQVNCLKSVTGATKDHSSGKICTPLKK